MRLLGVLLAAFIGIVSPCFDAEFHCTSGERIPQEETCDFKNDCKDGSDEEFCGSCDFEHHSCGWNNSIESQLRWKRLMANVTSTPGHDHTTTTPWGYFMHVDENQNSMKKAIFEYFVNTSAALGCQMSFWYHIYDHGNFERPSFYVQMQRENTMTELISISKSKTNGWENATAFIGNQPGGYKLLLSYTSSIFAAKDIMVDDITFKYCWEEEIPEGSSQLTCDFEEDTCSWYSDSNTGLLWKRSKGSYGDGSPGSDHTSGNGYYMFISDKSNQDSSSTARLLSYPQPDGQVICVSFWYHIFGNSIGSLKFITKHAGAPETVVWMRNGTQGNRWRFADLTFTSDTPIQFILEAMVSGTQGSISIDDIVVSSSLSGLCPAERECTFQGSLCGLQPHLSADVWCRVSGAQLNNSFGPTTDHTLGTRLGYYLSAQLWHHPVDTRVAMVTAVMDPTPPSGECWMFWYYMEGKAVGELTVYLQSPGGSRALLWTRTGDQGKHWRHGRVTVLSPLNHYQIIFEGVVGAEPTDIALDDLTVMNGVCPPPGFCDFEMDYCGLVNNPPAGSGIDWDWISGSSQVQFNPGVDHTTATKYGHFVFFSPSKSKVTETAHLESELLAALDPTCLEFWYYFNGWLTDKPLGLVLTVIVSDTTGLHSVWSLNGTSSREWHQARVDYNATGSHQIILQANRPASKEGIIALDDIHIMSGKACFDINPTTSPSYTTTPITTPPSSPMDCTFEEGLCNWNQDTEDVLNWTHITGFEVDQLWNGPLYDHTFGHKQGFYLLFNGSGYEDSENAVISTPVSPQISLCVEFWYYMLGPSVPSLELLLQRNSSKSLAWSRRGSQDLKWINAQVTIEVNDTVSLMFIGRRDTSTRGFVAIDDIKVKEGGCSSQIVCGFDLDWCGFENDVSHLSHWIRSRGDGLDHTYGTTHGFYLTVFVHNPEALEVAQLFTPMLTETAVMCIRFWYWWAGGPLDDLSVHTLWGDELSQALWQRSGAPSAGWEVAELTVTSPYMFRVIFKVTHHPGAALASVGLDDLSIRAGACDPTVSCDFESGQCTWVNVFKTHGHDWVQADGHFQGLPNDHTTQTPGGHFLLSFSQYQNKSSVAQVVSEWIQVQPQDISVSCFSFWYHMDGSDSGTLRVYIRSGPAKEQLILQTNTGGSGWNLFSESVNRTKPFQVLIEAESKNIGFMAIDDITLAPGFCSVNGTFLAFVGCSFENNTCDWEDVSISQIKWQRHNSASGGPTVDHTLGTELGWYMLAEAGRGHRKDSMAGLQSPTMKQASAACTLHFYYHMYGQGTGSLKVMLRDGSTGTVLWWLEGNMGDSWHHGEVVVGRTPQEFTVLFEASWSSSQLGHIAIDDVDFSNCTLPEPQPLCPLPMFACNNSVCVEPGQVCDFSDDCGDESDETNCELLGVVDRCAFEQGLCSWAGIEVSSPVAQWIRQNGTNAWPQSGPPRDHSQNTAAGHYIVPHQTEPTSEILSSTLLPSTNCTVRFYYYSLHDAARLAVHSRREQAGNEDTLLWLRNQSHSYSWQRAEVTFSCSTNTKIVLRYEYEDGPRGLVALDDISFSMNCILDPNNSQLPHRSTTSLPPTSSDAITTPMPPTNPCKEAGEYFCWESEAIKCIPSSSRCDYLLDCPLGEDEGVCGPCTFESGQCQWLDTSEGSWQRQRASNSTVPPTDHTTVRGHYMTVNHSSMQAEARLQSPTLPPPSAYCQILFHFHMSGEGAGSLRLLMQQDGGSEEILWSRSHNSLAMWTPVYLPLGRLYARPYKVLFSSQQRAGQGVTTAHTVAVDDISFLNCERSYTPPGVFDYDCSFEDGLCGWIQVAEDDLDFQRRPGPAGDHTTGTGQYLYIGNSPPSVRGNVAQLMSPMLSSGGDKGYCITFWYHMSGAAVGSLKMVLQTTYPIKKILVWQQQGSHRNDWQEVRIPVTLPEVHRLVLEATVGGEAGDIAIDDITLFYGPCATSDTVVIGLTVGLILLGAAVFSIVWVLKRGDQHSTTSQPGTMDNGITDKDIFDLFDCAIDETHTRDSASSFGNPNVQILGIDSITSSDV